MQLQTTYKGRRTSQYSNISLSKTIISTLTLLKTSLQFLRKTVTRTIRKSFYLPTNHLPQNLGKISNNMKNLGLTASVLGWLLQTIPIAGVDIEFYPQQSCYPGPQNQMIARCQNIPKGSCCNIPRQQNPSAVYVGPFSPPGGVGMWYYHNQRVGGSACSGTLKDSAGAADPNGVCMVDQGPQGLFLPGLAGALDNGGAAWFDILDIVKKPPAGQRQPAWYIQPPVGFTNTPLLRSGISRRGNALEARKDESKRDAPSSTPVSWDDWKNIVDNTTEYQCSGDIHYADVFGWEENSNGVWVLENPTEEQVEKLGTFAPAENQAAVNEYLKEVGATHYDDYKFDSGGMELEENVNGTCSLREFLPGVTYR